MIRNEQQYRITKQQIINFEKAISELNSGAIEKNNVHPLLRKAEIDALTFQQSELSAAIQEYEALRSGKMKVLEVNSFEDLPLGLIRARIAKGLSQKELAEKLGLKEQQIQRYEASNYSTASFDRIKDIVTALDIKITKEIFVSAGLFSKNTFLNNLKSIGLTKELLLTKILQYDLASKIENLAEYTETEAKNFLQEAAAVVSRILGIDPSLLLKSKSNLDIDLTAVRTARFKKTILSNKEKISAYTIYAHTIALILLENTKGLNQKKVLPAAEFRKFVIERYSQISLKNLLNAVWDFGIAVFPLKDPGSFHGACWRVDGRNVIVLKQKTMSESRWLYDLSHELCHASQHPNELSLDIIEPNSLTRDWIESEDEREANYYAGELILGTSVDDFAEEAILSSKKDLVRLKGSVNKIAKREHLDVGALANYIAFRLQSEQSINWWSTAQNLQTVISDPFDIAKEVLLERINLSEINEFDRQLIIRALA